MEQATQTSTSTRFDSRLWGLLLLLCGVLFLDGMDVSMVAVAFAGDRNARARHISRTKFTDSRRSSDTP